MVASSDSQLRLGLFGIHSLPNEILSYIFLNAINHNDHNNNSSDSDSGFDVAFFPLTISHTCSRWRKVSISTGSLWTAIKLFLPCCRGQFAYLEAWLSRSKSYPLDMLLDFRDEEWNWDSEEDHPFTLDSASRIISLILPHAKRWRHIEFFTDTWAPIHAFLDRVRNLGTTGVESSLPILKSVALSRCNAYFARKGECFEPIALREPIPLFGGARLPALSELSLVGVHLDWETRSSFENLLELELKFHAYDVMPTFSQFADILGACQNLERLSIVGWGPRLDSNSTRYGLRQIISMPKLTKLCFGFVDVEYAVGLLSLFHLPSLSKLELEDVAAIVDPMGPSDATALLDLLECSTTTPESDNSRFYPLHQIECLELRSLRCNSEAAFANFLRRFSTLEKINLTDADSVLLSALGPYKFFTPEPPVITKPENDGRSGRRPSLIVSSLSTSLAPCPQLVDLVCRRVDTSVLSSVISARAKAGSGVRPLKSVQLELDSGGEEGDDSGDDEASSNSGSSSRLSDRDRTLLLNTGVDLRITDNRC